MPKKSEPEELANPKSKQTKTVAEAGLLAGFWRTKPWLLTLGAILLITAVWLSVKYIRINDKSDNDTVDNSDNLSQIELRQSRIDNAETVHYTDYVAQANNYWFEGNLDKAFENYSEANKLKPNQPEILSAMGLIKRQAKDTDAAIDFFQQAIAAYAGENLMAREKLNQYIELTKNGDFETEIGSGNTQNTPQ